MSNRTLTLMMGFVAVLIIAVGIVFVAVFASGGDDDTDPADDNGDRPATTGDICTGDTLVTFGADPLSVLDPIQVRDEGTGEYIIEIFGGLVTLNPELEVVGDIAERWDVSPDGTVYTFHLRDNVVFHNGRRVTAEDFKYSFERAADPANNSPVVTLYMGDIVGVREKFRGEVDEVEGVRVVDEQTLEITIDAPKSYFLAEMTYPVAFVVDREQIERDPRNWTLRPNGTGPYKLAEFSLTERVRLIANDRYHLGEPLLREVSIELAGGSLLTRYEADEIHIAAVPSFELEGIRGGSSALSDDYVESPRMAFSYIAFNSQQAPFDDPKVRQALAMSINRDQINEALLLGSQRVADGILPPEMPGYEESISTYEYDPEAAAELLAESTYADNMPRIILTYGGAGGNAPDVLARIQNDWQTALGVEVELQASDPAAFLRDLRRGTFQMFSTGWIADYPDPEDFIDKLFASDSEQNEFGYENPEVDALIQEARTEQDNDTRLQLYHEAEQMIIDDAAVVPIFWPVDHLLIKSCVQNWPVTPMTIPKFRYIEIKPE
ncbi:MAG: ABC transporter substrate-binding protein [Tepidiformaceae bacterium]